MFARLLLLAIPACLTVACTSPESHEADVAAIEAQVAKYVQSIDAADTALAAEVWLPSPEASFINPRGRQNGWEAIRANFYEKAMGGTFSERKLTPGEVIVHVFGDTAVAEFNWSFEAKWRKDGTTMQSSGRESQVFTRAPDGGWRLVHVHYSGPPIVADRQGF
jgi:ketosteroid isomerase-like protein